MPRTTAESSPPERRITAREVMRQRVPFGTMRVRELLAVLLVVATAALLTRVPILAVPSYEPALVIGSLAAFLLCLLAGRRAMARPREVSLRWGLLATSPAEGVLAETRATARLAAAMIGLPLVILLTEAIRSECRLDSGPLAFLLVTIPAAIIGGALGTLVGTLTRRPRLFAAIVVLVIVASALATLAEALAGPRTILHSVFLGPITPSGFMGYDRDATFPTSVYLHRAWSLVVAALMLCVAALVRWRRDAPALAEGEDDGSVRAAADSWESSKLSPAARARFLLHHHERSAWRSLAGVLLLALPFAFIADRAGLLPGQGLLE